MKDIKSILFDEEIIAIEAEYNNVIDNTLAIQAEEEKVTIDYAK